MNDQQISNKSLLIGDLVEASKFRYENYSLSPLTPPKGTVGMVMAIDNGKGTNLMGLGEKVYSIGWFGWSPKLSNEFHRARIKNGLCTYISASISKVGNNE